MRLIGLGVFSLVFLFLAHYSLSQRRNSGHEKPNILIIMTDQQSASMMSCRGNKWVNTPAIDRMAAGGIRFDLAYVTNPVCLPSRLSIMTGQYPSAAGIRENTSKIDTAKIEKLYSQSIGHILRRGGYQTYYAGKAHLPLTKKQIEPWGFHRITYDERNGLAAACAKFLLDRNDGDGPFLLFASFIGPHDICDHGILYAGLKPDIGYVDAESRKVFTEAMKIPEGVSMHDFLTSYCPPLPANHQPMTGETCGVEWIVNDRPFRRIIREEWTAVDWRMHRWAYKRLTEQVDEQIGVVMNALERSGLAENTVVIFTSDHGENGGAHKLDHKGVFYEESINVPLIVSYPWITRRGMVDDRHLINNGLDILPTVCDIAGIAPPSGLMGRSILPLTQQKKVRWRTHTFVENSFGFLIHTGRFKYELDDRCNGNNREMFVDLEYDRGETRNLIHEPEYKREISALKDDLLSYMHDAGMPVR